jgi:hypothetical protein
MYQSLAHYEVKPAMVLAVGPIAGGGGKGIHIGPTVITGDNGAEIMTRCGREMIRVQAYMPSRLERLS